MLSKDEFRDNFRGIRAFSANELIRAEFEQRFPDSNERSDVERDYMIMLIGSDAEFEETLQAYD